MCITGVASIVAAGATITAESCSPADNALSPGETVTVNFGLKNNGTAATTNLVATLQATGGVTSPSGPQNYGSIPPDNTTVVTRPFTFTVDPSMVCGDTVTATLQLQDGANQPGYGDLHLAGGRARRTGHGHVQHGQHRRADSRRRHGGGSDQRA